MKAHLVQMDITWEDPSSNWKTVQTLLSAANPEKNELVVLPEMFDSGFSLNTDRTADRQGRTLDFLRDLARSAGVYVQGGRTVLDEGETLATNRAPVVSPSGEVLVEYAKLHPFSFGREPERFQPGTDVLTYTWRAGDDELRVCPSVCYDLRFPELFRSGLDQGALCFAHGANWPAARKEHWRILNIARAIENQAFVLAVNRTGSDPHLDYAGGTIAVGPKGEILGELADEQAVLTVELDPEAVRAWRDTFPAWKDRRL